MNRGVIEAHESGIVTSASLMVLWPAAAEAAAHAGERPDLALTHGLGKRWSPWGSAFWRSATSHSAILRPNGPSLLLVHKL